MFRNFAEFAFPAPVTPYVFCTFLRVREDKLPRAESAGGLENLKLVEEGEKDRRVTRSGPPLGRVN